MCWFLSIRADFLHTEKYIKISKVIDNTEKYSNAFIYTNKP